MRYACRAIDAAFFEKAPWIFKNSVELAAPPERVFAIFEDGESWPKWFSGIKRVEWTSARPFGVGTTRVVTLATLAVDEHFFRWEPDRRFSFYLTGHSLPMARALAEDYLLEPLGDGRCRFTYTVAIDPRLGLRATGPLGRSYFGAMFRNATTGLQSFVKASSKPSS
jgi:hypothetical protein